jgi:hypothetical protein
LVHVFSSARDKTIHSRLTLNQYVDFVEEKILEKDARKGEVEQGLADSILRRADVTDAAKAELKAEKKRHGKRVSIASMKSNLRQNRDEEIKYLREQQREQEQDSKPACERIAIAPPDDAVFDTPSAADLLMEELHARGINQ